MAEVARAGRLEEVNDLEKRFGPFSCSPYPEPPKTAYALPIILPGLEQTFGALVAGVSSRRALDDAYRTFYLMLGDSVSSALANARAYEEERKRAEALAEIDRAKTVFFSNVSHEFRTPLTLMLGPLEDMSAEVDCRLKRTIGWKSHAEIACACSSWSIRCSIFRASRPGASRPSTNQLTWPNSQPIWPASSDPTVERAGIELVVDCQPLSEPVYIDREMWEKIVLNLLSNAFKFTFEGEIDVRLRIADCGLRIEEIRESGGQERLQSTIHNPRYAILTVRDTGTGIPEPELPRLFERFHRVKGARGRSYEGSGIGLALVQELVKLHCGEVRVESEIDQGASSP